MKKNALLLTSVAALASVPSAVSASSPATQLAVCVNNATNFFGFQPWYACLKKSADGSPKIESINDVFLIIFPLVDSLVKAAALVAVGVIFFMFIRMIFSLGNSGEMAKAALGIRDAAIGLVISLVAIAIVNFVTGSLT